jgi:hypothetical protein
MAYCKKCEKLAFLNQPHKCINCPRYCNNKEDRWCSFCSTTKNICQVCGKDMGTKPSEEKIHPFYGGGCKTCTSRWGHK